MLCPTLAELPPPPPGKTGWPWTEETEQLPDRMPDGQDWPKISVVTPSYNQGQFIEETIRSVLLQGYPNLEYTIIDGGSTDETVEIIKKYQGFLSCWVSEKDNGQADALNKGFAVSTGSICAYLNSDDLLLPGALFAVADYAIKHPQAQWYASTCLCGESLDSSKHWKPGIISFPSFVVNQAIAQQGVFWRDTAKEKPWFDASRKMRMDHKFFAEIYLRCSAPSVIDATTSFFRQHSDSKTYNFKALDREEQRQLVEEMMSRTDSKTSQAIHDEYYRINNIVATHKILTDPDKSLSSKWKRLIHMFRLLFVTPFLLRDRIFISAFAKVLLDFLYLYPKYRTKK